MSRVFTMQKSINEHAEGHKQMTQKIFSTAETARLLGTDPWRVRRLFELGVIDDVPRIGRHRVISATMLPLIIEALQKRNWLKREHTARCVAEEDNGLAN